MGTWPNAWREHQERAERDAACGARLRRCQSFPQHPHPLLQGAVVAVDRSFSSGEVFAQWLPPWPHPAGHTRAGSGAFWCCLHPWQLASAGGCERRCLSFLFLLCCPNAGKGGSGSWEGSGMGRDGWLGSPVTPLRSDPAPVIQPGVGFN